MNNLKIFVFPSFNTYSFVEPQITISSIPCRVLPTSAFDWHILPHLYLLDLHCLVVPRVKTELTIKGMQNYISKVYDKIPQEIKEDKLELFGRGKLEHFHVEKANNSREEFLEKWKPISQNMLTLATSWCLKQEIFTSKDQVTLSI